MNGGARNIVLIILVSIQLLFLKQRYVYYIDHMGVDFGI